MYVCTFVYMCMMHDVCFHACMHRKHRTTDSKPVTLTNNLTIFIHSASLIHNVSVGWKDGLNKHVFRSLVSLGIVSFALNRASIQSQFLL